MNRIIMELIIEAIREFGPAIIAAIVRAILDALRADVGKPRDVEAMVLTNVLGAIAGEMAKEQETTQVA